MVCINFKPNSCLSFVALATIILVALYMHFINMLSFFFNLGLKYDREWLLQGSGGEILTQKKVTEILFFVLYVLNL